METLTIGEVAKRAGIQTSAIRYYESVGVLPRPQRLHGHRRYDTGILSRLSLIHVAQSAGFTITEIHRLFDGFDKEVPASERWQELARQKLIEVNALIDHAQAMKRLLEEELLRCNCVTLEECAIHCDEKENRGKTPVTD
jgi:MerR family redox-sensitive transcriptional activator SoxR